MKTLFCLLIFASFAMAQPVWGPYAVVNSDSTIQDVEVCVRGDTADVVWIEDTLAYHTSLYLSNGNIIDEAQIVYPLRGWSKQLLGELLALDNGWACIVYQDQHDEYYTPPNTGLNRTNLIVENESGLHVVALDSGQASWYYPQYGESQNSGFSLTELSDGRIAAAWIDYIFLMYDADIFPNVCVIDQETLSCVNYRAGEQTFGSDAEDRAFVYTTSQDSLTSVYSDFEPALCTFSELDNPESPYFECNEFPGCSEGYIIEFGKTIANRLLLLLNDWNANSITPVSLEFDSSGNPTCSEYPPVGVSGELTTFFHPSYGFAALQVNPGFLFLARIDTTGAEVQPVGILYETDGEHFIVDADVTITDSGQVVAVWSEYTDWSEGPREMKIAWTEWDTFLDTPEQGVPSVPSKLSLSAYPNPFNSTVTIQYDLPQAAQVELLIFDLQGRLVETLRDQFTPSGSHLFAWSPNGLASGVSFARLKTAALEKTAKLLYIR